VPDLDLVNVSRLQFAVTALYHFLFVPLTLGLSWILVIMESVYVMTAREIYRDMTRFWGLLFGINFVMGVTTGLTLEFQFGTNWAYYSHYVGDVFGVPLAIEGLMAFILESTFVGLFFFGWERLNKVQHLLVTFLVAFGSNLSALWILIANGWMQNPVGAEFNYETMRMEVTDILAVFFNTVAQSKFVHTVAAGYVTACMFVLGVSSYYLLKARDVGFALRSFAVAAGFGLASALSVIVLGDESGYTTGLVQQVKLAAIEAEWDTQPAPAAITAFGIPNQKEQRTDYAIKIPWLLGLIATRSVDKEITGIKDLVRQAEQRIPNGMVAYAMLEKLRAGDKSPEVRERFEETKQNLGTRCCSRSTRPRSPTPLRSKSGSPRRTRSRRCGRCSGRSASWWRSACGSCSSSPRRSSSSRSATWRRNGGCCGSRSTAFRCRGSRRSSAGLLPNTAASRGRSAACCRRSSPCRASMLRRFMRASRRSSSSTRRCS